jgi:hypothetical protein
MLTDKERKVQARLARILISQKNVAKNSKVIRSGNVPCYLSSMTESKKADKGFYYCVNTRSINQLKYEIELEKGRKQSEIVRVRK